MNENGDLVSQFESLGDNCEFGFVQRHSGVEPGGLLRWTVSPPEVLANALEQRFEGIYEFDNLTPFAPKMVNDRKSGLKFHSKMTSTDGVFDHDEGARREIHEAEVGKIAYLRDKLNSLLESGEKTFIYKCNAGVSDALVERLASVISSRGKSRFLYVSADPEKAGTVEVRNGSFAKGYVTRFAPYTAANDIDFDSWIQMLQSYQTATA